MYLIVHTQGCTILSDSPCSALILRQYSLLGFHGECKNLEQTIKNFSRTYGTYIDFLVSGHNHHQLSSNVGIESDIIGAPSLIGVDDYALSLHKTSDPGATLFILEEHKGKVIEYNIKL